MIYFSSKESTQQSTQNESVVILQDFVMFVMFVSFAFVMFGSIGCPSAA